ncbi:PhoX family phosphatase [uncultured Serinicoccus sp.]|uniref:PhoX family protein n=1 Tax=uncultured Serinicoccus sp. TaxID=735514 RepID=UPI00260B2149|nr:PhoX family phosphatase [uncultured Serinicoccus sp.]
MTQLTGRRSLLPLLAAHPGGRSAATCRYRCGDACSQPVPNTSSNSYFGDVVQSAVARRTVLAGGTAAMAGVAWAAAPGTAAAAGEAEGGLPGTEGRRRGFPSISPTPADVDDLVVPEGFTWAPVISWGDPVEPGAPRFDVDRQSVEAQKGQAGYNADYLTLRQDGDRGWRRRRGVIVVNNEYTNPEMMFPDWSGEVTPEQAEIEMAAHGMTIVEVRRTNDRSPWTYQRRGTRNRRIHAWTTFALDGPAAGQEWMRTSTDRRGRRVLGTLNNCAGGDTPWGTVLSGEENVNQYFDATGAPDPEGRLARYGITSGGRGWEQADRRFSVLDEPNEVNRFGWIVEVDPDDPDSTPVKHTALGRFKHEGATIRLAHDGRAVAYMGDDERFDYIYKFVSRRRYREGDKRHNMRLLSEGDLYVARFTGDGLQDGQYDGDGEWLPLVVGGESRVEGMSVAEVCTWTRLAADRVGPTKMDRPEDVQPDPTTGRVYVALTNNTARTPGQIDEANPRANNTFGHVIEWREAGDDAAALRFRWRIVLVAGDPSDPSTYFSGLDRREVTPISCPDNVAFDGEPGHLWISTDGAPGTIGTCDGLFRMPTTGRDRGLVQQFLSVPTGAECCGPVISWADRSVLVSVQHPGEGGSSAYPYLGDSVPRPGVAHVYPGRRRR